MTGGKTMGKCLQLTFTIIIFLAATVTSHAFTIEDKYIGADPTHNWAHTDVIGEAKYYDIAGMNVKTAGTSMTVDIITSFVSQTSSSAIWGDQTHIGDLFIGTGGWNPKGSAPYLNDNASTSGTKWDYVVVLSPHVPIKSGDPVKKGSASVYSTKDGSFVKSNIGTLSESSWVYRADQYVQFTPNSNANAIYTGTWDITDKALIKDGINYGNLQIDFDYSNISGAGPDWAFRWAMTCANDVIEGQTKVPPVPEPATITLLLGGLLSLAVYGRRRMKS